MTKKEAPTKSVRVREGFLLTRDDGSRKWYDPGLQEMPTADAEHDYTAIFLEQAPPPTMGDADFAEAKRRYANERLAEYRAADEIAREAEMAHQARIGAANPSATSPLEDESDDGDGDEEAEEDGDGADDDGEAEEDASDADDGDGEPEGAPPADPVEGAADGPVKPAPEIKAPKKKARPKL